MRVIGVIDVRGGRAVHARAGQRDRYAPIGDAVELARAYVDRHGLSELYVADLDAITAGGPERPALQHGDVARPFQGRDTIEQIVAVGAPVWLDAAVSSVDRARRAVALGAAHVVVGLETLPSFETLRAICDGIGGQNVAFSLDLREGAPIGVASGDDAVVVAARAAERGVDAIIVLDLARVGTSAGVDHTLIARVREAAPGITLVAGGGIRGPEDLDRLAAIGCDGALVATALQDGRLDGYVAALKGPGERAGL